MFTKLKLRGCHARGETAEAAKAELENVFIMIVEEYQEMCRSLPKDVELVINNAS